MIDPEKVRAHWEGWAERYQKDLKATTKTPTIKRLEIAAIARALRTAGITEGQVLEVGCGNGHNLFVLAEMLPNIKFSGLDYVPAMIDNAKRIRDEKGFSIEFAVGDILNLNISGEFDAIFTDRCIINLASAEEQERALDQLTAKVRTGGYLLILENSTASRGNQNTLREAVGLEPRPAPEFNLFLDEQRLLDHARTSLEHVSTEDFGSLHDVILYVLIPLAEGEINYEHPLVEAATRLLLALDGDGRFGDYGQNRLFVFRRAN